MSDNNNNKIPSFYLLVRTSVQLFAAEKIFMLVNYMEQASSQAREKGGFSSRVNGFSRDLLVDKVWDRNNFHNDNRKEDNDNAGIELSLGLSLNGRFGVEPKKDRMPLLRSCSVSTFCMVAGETHEAAPSVPVAAAAYTALSRTCSLPTEVEDWRKRKELQSLRRMEAKRRRMDKIKVLRSGRERVDSEDNSSEEIGSNSNSNGSGLVSSINGNGNGNGNGMAWSQRSVGSQGSNSSGLVEFDSQPIQGTNFLVLSFPSSPLLFLQTS